MLDRKIVICYNMRVERNMYAGVAELADAPDLGSGVYDVGVRGLSPAPYLPHVFAKYMGFLYYSKKRKQTAPSFVLFYFH